MIFNKVITRMKEAFEVSAYARTAKELGKLSDRQLADIGVSRELLQAGAKAYPWREDKIAQTIPNNVTSLHTQKVIENTPIMPSTPKAA